MLSNGDAISSCNRTAWDGTNGNHAESKIVVMVELGGHILNGATLYTTCRPCARCAEMLLPWGLKSVYYRDKDDKNWGLRWLTWHGVQVDSGWILGQVQESWAERNGVAG